MWQPSSLRGRMRTVQVIYDDAATGRTMVHIRNKLAERFAGYQSEDRQLWGCELFRREALWWLTQLNGYRLLVPPESLPAFREECNLAISLIDRLVVETGCEASDIQQALQNILFAIERATTLGGSVEVS